MRYLKFPTKYQNFEPTLGSQPKERDTDEAPREEDEHGFSALPNFPVFGRIFLPFAAPATPGEASSVPFVSGIRRRRGGRGERRFKSEKEVPWPSRSPSVSFSDAIFCLFFVDDFDFFFFGKHFQNQRQVKRKDQHPQNRYK